MADLFVLPGYNLVVLKMKKKRTFHDEADS